MCFRRPILKTDMLCKVIPSGVIVPGSSLNISTSSSNALLTVVFDKYGCVCALTMTSNTGEIKFSISSFVVVAASFSAI